VSPRSARLVAQAKINLALRVLSRETSGYHQIETLFCRVDFGDHVSVRATEGERSLECRGAHVPPGALGDPHTNLAWRAADAYARRAGWPRGFAIEIEKHIPIGSGLGGGSADAGAVLRALNALSPAPLELSALLAVAASLGADVPFLTQESSTAALAWGRGERMIPLRPLPSRVCLIFARDLTVSTADAYGWLDAAPPLHNAALIAPDGLTSWEGIAVMAHNDFEAVVGVRHPEIAQLLRGLRDPSARTLVGDRPIVQLSGTGSAVFVVKTDGVLTDGAPIEATTNHPGLRVIAAPTAERVEPVILSD
jgi:4-diphosphocytidyl-2-C-methyl-D-erythritol kinase